MAEQESNVYTEIETGTAEDQVWVGLTDFENCPSGVYGYMGSIKPWRWVKCRPPISKTQSQAG